MARTAHVLGAVAAGFEPVQTVFAEHLAEMGEGGAAFTVLVDGELVVDLWAGSAGEGPWRRDTRALLASATKGIAAIVVARLVERGVIDVDAPVAKYWPEFAAGCKSDVTVAHVLSHSAGLPSVPGYREFLGPNGEGWEDTEEILRRLELAEPEWPPGSARAYHAVTYGWLVGEIVRRAAGVSLGTLLREEIAVPLGIELDLGTPLERQGLVAPTTLSATDQASMSEQLRAVPSSLSARQLLSVEGRNVITNIDAFTARPELLAIEQAAVNGTGTARALATLWGALANGGSHAGVHVLSPATIDAFAAERHAPPVTAGAVAPRWGLGFQRPVRAPAVLPRIWGPNDEAFGHQGGGAQTIGFADPVTKIGVGFIRSHYSWTSPLGGLLVDSAYQCLSGKAA